MSFGEDHASEVGVERHQHRSARDLMVQNLRVICRSKRFGHLLDLVPRGGQRMRHAAGNILIDQDAH